MKSVHNYIKAVFAAETYQEIRQVEFNSLDEFLFTSDEYGAVFNAAETKRWLCFCPWQYKSNMKAKCDVDFEDHNADHDITMMGNGEYYVLITDNEHEVFFDINKAYAAYENVMQRLGAIKAGNCYELEV